MSHNIPDALLKTIPKRKQYLEMGNGIDQLINYEENS